MTHGFWAGLDPAAKLAAACLISIFAACAQTIGSAALSLGSAILLLLSAWPGLPFALPRLAAVNAFVAAMAIIVPLTAPAPYAWQWGWLHLSLPGLRLCALVALKANAIAAVFIALVAPMPIAALGAALSALGCPDKLAWLFLLMDRNVHMLKREWGKLWEAALLRGFAPKTSLRSYRVYGALLGILLIRAHDRGNAAREAMLLAGFDGSLPFKRKARLGPKEAICAAIVCAFAAIALLPAIHAA